MGSLATRSVRRLLAAVAARSSGIRTLFVVAPIFLLGGALSAYGFVMAYFSLYRLLGLVHYSPHMLAGGLLICLGLLSAVALRRADRTVGSFFEERARNRS